MNVTGPVSAGVPDWLKDKRTGPKGKYPWRAMAVGQTFEVLPAEDRGTFKSFRVVASTKGRRLGMRFRCHELPDGVWQVYRES